MGCGRWMRPGLSNTSARQRRMHCSAVPCLTSHSGGAPVMRSASVAPGAVSRLATPLAKFSSEVVTGLPSMGARPPLAPLLAAVDWRASSDVLTWLQGTQWSWCRLLL